MDEGHTLLDDGDVFLGGDHLDESCSLESVIGDGEDLWISIQSA